MRFLRRFRADKTEPTWQGVYSRYEDVPRHGPGFSGGDWRNDLALDLAHVRDGNWTDEVVLEHEVLLLVLQLLGAREYRIVDFGGGYGATFFYLRQVLPSVTIRYKVIEVPPVAEAAATTVAAEGLIFDDVVQAGHGAADVVFVKSALQYVPDYRATATALFTMRARFVLLEKFSGVDAKSFASAQRVPPGSAVPYWFISTREIIELAAEHGYSCVLRRQLLRDYEQQALPAAMRMRRTSTLLFLRDE